MASISAAILSWGYCCLFRNLYDLSVLYYSSTEAMFPGKLCKWLHLNSKYKMNEEQQDAHELLIFLAHQIVSECIQAQIPLPDALFESVLKVQTFCGTCSFSEFSVDVMTSFYLCLDEQYSSYNSSIAECTMEQLLNCYFKSEELDVFCSNCNSEKLKRRRRIKDFPKVLILVIQRYDCSSNTSKLDCKVSPAIEIQLEDRKYLLGSIIRRLGRSINNGHFVADILIDGVWHTVNDSQVDGCSTADSIYKSSYVYIYRSC
jgi:uncharacterized UBP type Zn finger protein